METTILGIFMGSLFWLLVLRVVVEEATTNKKKLLTARGLLSDSRLALLDMQVSALKVAEVAEVAEEGASMVTSSQDSLLKSMDSKGIPAARDYKTLWEETCKELELEQDAYNRLSQSNRVLLDSFQIISAGLNRIEDYFEYTNESLTDKRFVYSTLSDVTEKLRKQTKRGKQDG